MSYILDALQRAEAERDRGAVPGLHSHPVPPPVAPKVWPARPGATRVVAVVVALGAVAAGWWLWRSLIAAPLTQTPLLAPTAPVAATIPVVAPTNIAVSAEPVARVAAPRTPPVAPDLAQAVVSATPVTTPAKTPEAGPNTPANAPVLGELPEDIRRQIPALAVTGAVYSDNPAQRLLLLNGQVLSQGSLAAPDVILEHIGTNSSEFNFRGTRFRLVH